MVGLFSFCDDLSGTVCRHRPLSSRKRHENRPTQTSCAWLLVAHFMRDEHARAFFVAVTRPRHTPIPASAAALACRSEFGDREPENRGASSSAQALLQHVLELADQHAA